MAIDLNEIIRPRFFLSQNRRKRHTKRKGDFQNDRNRKNDESRKKGAESKAGDQINQKNNQKTKKIFLGKKPKNEQNPILFK